MTTIAMTAPPKPQPDPAVSEQTDLEHFRFFFVSASDRVEGFEIYEGASDADALERARSVLAYDPHSAAIEIWNRNLLVGRVDR